MKKSQSITSKLPAAVAILGLLLVWHLVCTFGLVPGFMLPSPGQVLSALWTEFPLLLQHARITLTEAALGLGVTVSYTHLGSKTLAQNDAVSLTLFSFSKGEEISTHTSHGDALVTCLEGVGRITVDGVDYMLREGEAILMPAEHPHAVRGEEDFKMLLTVVF